MSEAMWLAGAAALTLTGMGWLALSMDVHWGQAMHRAAEASGGVQYTLRVLGVLALGLALWACLLADRPSMAVLVWVLLMAGSAVSVAMLLARRPRWLALLWPISA
jgi:hypothetical protein